MKAVYIGLNPQLGTALNKISRKVSNTVWYRLKVPVRIQTRSRIVNTIKVNIR